VSADLCYLAERPLAGQWVCSGVKGRPTPGGPGVVLSVLVGVGPEHFKFFVLFSMRMWCIHG